MNGERRFGDFWYHLESLHFVGESKSEAALVVLLLILVCRDGCYANAHQHHGENGGCGVHISHCATQWWSAMIAGIVIILLFSMKKVAIV